jgi:peptidoglycan hydrolase-like protein with peptidoglycan-binding domain
MRKNIFTLLLIISSFVITFSQVSASTCVTLTKPLSKGSENNEVLMLQQFLADGGYLVVKPNGYFGENTKKAVVSFQKAQKILGTGAVGQVTRAKIKEVSCPIVTPQVVNKISTTTTATSTKEETKTVVVVKEAQVVAPVKETPAAAVVQEMATIYVKTFLAVDIASDSAVLKQTGGVDGEKHWFEWGNTAEMKNVTPQTVASTTYSYKITGLLPSTAYYFRAVASVASSTDRKAETAYGDVRYFTTPAAEVVAQALPTVSISSNGSAVNSSGSTKITWTSTDTSVCSFTDGEEGGDWTNQRPLSGQYITRPITKSTVFSISCRNNKGYTVTGSVTVAAVVN